MLTENKNVAAWVRAYSAPDCNIVPMEVGEIICTSPSTDLTTEPFTGGDDERNNYNW